MAEQFWILDFGFWISARDSPGNCGRLEVVEEQVRGESVPIAPEAGHLSEADRGNKRAVAKAFAGMGVRDVYLDDRDWDGFDGVTQGDRGVSVSAGVDDDPGGEPALLVEEVDQ